MSHQNIPPVIDFCSVCGAPKDHRSLWCDNCIANAERLRNAERSRIVIDPSLYRTPLKPPIVIDPPIAVMPRNDRESNPILNPGYCTNCGQAIQGSWNYCRRCGCKV
jgi:predicted amidophosphoribosyltransferase